MTVALTAALVLGIEHSFEPDHVAAVSTIVTRSRSPLRSIFTGAAWGTGHTVALFAAGLLIVLVKVQLLELYTGMLELAVGLMLVVMGCWSIYRIGESRIHFHAHTHNGRAHAHLHSHKGSTDHEHTHVPFAVGIVHGLAGSGGLTVLALATMADLSQALAFILVFGVGLVLGMSLVSSALTAPIALAAKHSRRLTVGLAGAAGLASTLLGITLIFRLVV